MRQSASRSESPHVAKDRDYLTPEEANALIAAASKLGRNSFRDQVLVRMLYRHGLRASEASQLRWSHLHLDDGSNKVTVHRLKGGTMSTHTMDRDEVAALKRLRKDSDSPNVFTSERGAPISLTSIERIVERAGVAAKIGFHVHPHMLRHAAGHMLADMGVDTRRIQDHLGHSDIRNTQRYTQLSPHALKNVRVR